MAKTLTVAYFACNCAIMAIDTSHPDWASLRASWIAQGYDVRELSVAEINQIHCTTPHTTDVMAKMGRVQKAERNRAMKVTP